MEQAKRSALTDKGAGEALASVQFIGTATVLIRCASFTILTDPNFIRKGERIHIGYLMHSTRLLDPAMDISDLPHVDVVFVSHIHADHIDPLAQHLLDKRVPLVTTRQAAGILRGKGFRNTYALRPWQSIEFFKEGIVLRVTATPAVHVRAPFPAFFPSVIGAVFGFKLADERRIRIYQTGDTLLNGAVTEAAKRIPELDAAVLHLGGARIGPLRVSMNAAEGVALMRRLNARKVIPVHYGDYPEMREPVDEFLRASAAAGLAGRVKHLARGEAYEVY
jgi:L-ascorbate metabolism protein UlaG (beta-lactamase superfamily)